MYMTPYLNKPDVYVANRSSKKSPQIETLRAFLSTVVEESFKCPLKA